MNDNENCQMGNFPIGTIKKLVSDYWWHGSEYRMAQKVPSYIKSVTKIIFENTGEIFDWKKGIWEKQCNINTKNLNDEKA